LKCNSIKLLYYQYIISIIINEQSTLVSQFSYFFFN